MDRPKEERDLLIKLVVGNTRCAFPSTQLSYCNLAQTLGKDANCSSIANKWMISSRGLGTRDMGTIGHRRAAGGSVRMSRTGSGRVEGERRDIPGRGRALAWIFPLSFLFLFHVFLPLLLDG